MSDFNTENENVIVIGSTIDTENASSNSSMSVSEAVELIANALQSNRQVQIAVNISPPATQQATSTQFDENEIDLNQLGQHTVIIRREEDGKTNTICIDKTGQVFAEDHVDDDSELRGLLRQPDGQALTAGTAIVVVAADLTSYIRTWIPDNSEASVQPLRIAENAGGLARNLRQCMNNNTAVPYAKRMVKCINGSLD